ncbi:BTB/POZ and TAZ domain-containing protein 1 [Nicotiana sylvestris]|uniref:BTB/POZ and TAZ domain-containing protein 1 n=1 Tax=Nicotiana sylvestris TaxID=4096 RepID=A0A1U7WKM3_NICSY|nr:PREDICTED: BTB/POZ and TAZ domain-containing protein 1 [Nicotiana sylvestris]XP_016442626.1 PREDICTED: BTB/POZ and TAZ domain-containing protein 1-like [Nicotiana tabacum]
MSPNNFATDFDGFSGEMPEADIQIITSGGRRIPAHSTVLAAASSVLESILVRPQKRRSSEKTIRILGVPCDAVSVFVQFLSSFKCSEEQMEKHGIHLLALSHVYLVPQLKQRCTKGLAEQLTIKNAVDVLQLARLCDAPDLYLKCLKFISTNFKKVEKTEGWKFLQDHDCLLELEILQFMDEADSRKKRTRRHRREQNLYLQLSEAMDCIEHICTEGCTSVGPCHEEPCTKKLPCSKFKTCQGVQLLIRHFATCKRRVNGGCLRCKRMWQLLRLHSSICDKPDECRVPLCRQFKMKVQQKGDDALWESLVRKVVSARTISSLSLPKRKREEEPKMNLDHHQARSLSTTRCQ